jgi:phenylpropionate dioxygenase-like ring-hydroxylating dioxygenase large terminal subunit
VEIPCRRHDIGCPMHIKRKDLAGHTAACPHENYRSDVAELNKRLKESKEEVSKRRFI